MTRAIFLLLLGWMALFFLRCRDDEAMNVPTPASELPRDTNPGYPPKILNNCVDFVNPVLGFPTEIKGWNIEQINIPVFDFNNKFWYINPQIGFELSSSAIWRTLDGGNTWNSTALSSVALSSQFLHIQFFDDQRGIAVVGHYNFEEDATVYKTYDQGNTWTKWDWNRPIAYGSEMWLMDSITYIYTTPNSTETGFDISRDAGITWQHYYISDNFTGCKFHFLGRDTGFIASQNNQLYYTYDSGQTWKSTLLGNLFSNGGATVQFRDAQHGLVYSYSGMRETQNGGQTWEVISHRPVLFAMYDAAGGIFSNQHVSNCIPIDPIDIAYPPIDAFFYKHDGQEKWEQLSTLQVGGSYPLFILGNRHYYTGTYHIWQ